MSSGGTPYIGSKISLVSKAKIRYEGYLYTIDTEESTVTLAKVKSFGTEDRKAPNKVPARNEIYEYIVFRGSDIDDLHVAAGPKTTQGQVAEDPAIVQTGNTQPSMYQQQMPMQMGTPFPPPQSYGPFGGMPYGYPIGFRPQGNMPLSSVIGPVGMGDRNARSSPFDRYRQSPSPPSAGPVGSRFQPKDRDERSQSPESSQGIGGRSRDMQHSHESQSNAQKATREQRANQQFQKESGPSKERSQVDRSSGRKHSRDNGQQRERQSNRDADESKEQSRTKEKDQPKSSRNSKRQNEKHDSDARGTDSLKGKGDLSKGKGDQKENEKQRQLNEGQKKKEAPSDAQKNSVKDANRESSKEDYSSYRSSNNENARGHPRGRPRGRGRGRGAFNKTRFDKDFDFERANAKFNKEEVEKELLSALKKNVSLKDEDDVIIEDLDSPQDEIETDVNGEEVYYDKAKSFFDHISCDSSGPSSDQVSRRKERAINVETFGVGSWNYRGRPYRGRGGRGRGRGYNRGGQNARRGGGGGNRAWVDYDFDFEAAGIRKGGKGSRSGAS